MTIEFVTVAEVSESPWMIKIGNREYLWLILLNPSTVMIWVLVDIGVKSITTTAILVESWLLGRDNDIFVILINLVKSSLGSQSTVEDADNKVIPIDSNWYVLDTSIFSIVILPGPRYENIDFLVVGGSFPDFIAVKLLT